MGALDTFFALPYKLFLLIFNRLLNLAIYDGKTIHWEGRKANELGNTDIHPYWYERRPLAVHIEATAYALLALIERERAHNPRKDVLY